MANPFRIVNVVLLAFPGVEELDLFGAWAVLSKAAEVEAQDASAQSLRVRIVAHSETVTGSGGVTFVVHAGLEALALSDAVVVPGGRGAQQAADDPVIRSQLSAILERGGSLYSICTGSLIVAATGRAVNSCLAIHRHKRVSLLDFPIGQVGSGLVRDGKLISVGGDLSPSVKSLDVAFALLADLAPHTISRVSDRMELLPGRSNGSRVAAEGSA